MNARVLSTGVTALAACLALATSAGAQPAQPLFHDVHLHLTNYVQEGPPVRELLRAMGRKVGRAALFGIPLQQTWSHRVSGDYPPTYYLQSDAPLYYYSFTDAFIAQTYLSLSEAERKRFEPMITGFNPADMYGVEHIRRVLLTYPGVFSGIGEFTIHKEFVSSKVAGEVASLTDPALDRIFAFAGEVGLVVLLHNDIDVPFAKDGQPPVYWEQLLALFRRHPRTTVVWAHLGVGRVVQPVDRHLVLLQQLLDDPKLGHIHFDLSWSELAKYVVETPETARRTAQLLNQYPTRFLFGTDEVGPTSTEQLLRVHAQYAPMLEQLSPQTRTQILKANFERLFDAARPKVRAWEAAQKRTPR